MFTGGYIAYNNKISIPDTALSETTEINFPTTKLNKFIESGKPVLVDIIFDLSE